MQWEECLDCLHTQVYIDVRALININVPTATITLTSQQRASVDIHDHQNEYTAALKYMLLLLTSFNL